MINASPIQIFLAIFLLFALSRVILRLKGGDLTLGEFLFWFGLFAFALVGVIEPQFTTYAANTLGIGRGADVVIYASLVLLFYLIFRTNVLLENVRHELTQVVRTLALYDAKSDTESKDQSKNGKKKQKKK